MMWSYMRLEKFQNNTRIFRQRHVDSTHTRPSAIQWLRQSHYTHDMIVDEDKSARATLTSQKKEHPWLRLKVYLRFLSPYL